ncbi:MAG: type II toxin-antitoxin system HicA family toxin [Bryobacterales bacterium]|nr:type II toxin-antitoxin system HicA family toxin [Bryobacterales bacterium]
MPKLGPLSGEAVCRILEKHGFERVRQRGSHVVMQRKGKSGTTTVPVPLHSELTPGTMQSIVRQSGLPRSVFQH